MRKILVLFLCGIVLNSFAQPAVSINDTEEQHIFSFQEIEFTEDASGTLTIDDVTEPAFSSRFQPSVTFNPENVNRHSVYWHRVKILHNAASRKRWVIEFFDQTIDHIDFYIPHDGRYIKQSYGDVQEFSARPLKHKNFVIPISNETDEELTYYFRQLKFSNEKYF